MFKLHYLVSLLTISSSIIVSFQIRSFYNIYSSPNFIHKISFKVIFDSAMKVKNKMDQATALIDGLAGERIRWTEQLAQFKAETERLIGDVVLLTGFLGYTGPFNQEFRAVMQQCWLDSLLRRKIPVTLSLNIIDSLTDSATVFVQIDYYSILFSFISFFSDADW